jgi:hypothetical protein
MGVDISGKNPIIRSTRPEINWETATQEVKDQYWKDLGTWEKENPGDYFRANWWSWRPIAMLIEKVNFEKDLGLDTSYFGSNDGAGPDDQETCNRLADALQEIIDANPNLNEDDDRIFLVMGSWVNLDGSFMNSKKIEEMEDLLPEFGTVMYSSFIAPDGTIMQSAHSTSRWHLQEFINFLRECGGFEIW